MDLYELIARLGVALGIGLLIGLERGWHRRRARPGSRAAGIRTFAISALLGGLSAALAQALPKQDLGGTPNLAGGIVLGVAFAAYSIVITLFSREENRAAGSFSATTAIAGMLTFALGAYALLGDIRIAAGVAVAVTALLASREELHGWVEKITWPELRSVVVLLAMTFIALPILPNQPVGPFGGINLREVWIIAIVLASVSFLGYLAVKYFGARRGLLLAAAAGALASSTAVTIANARHAAAGEGSPRLLAAGVAIASAVMFLRVAGIVAALKPELLVLVAPALLAAALTAVGLGRRVDGLAADRWTVPPRAVSQSVRLPIGCRICGFPRRYHRAWSCGGGSIRHGWGGGRRDRRRAWRRRCDHRLDDPSDPGSSWANTGGSRDSCCRRQRYAEQGGHRRRHRPRLVRRRSRRHGVGFPRRGRSNRLVDLRIARAVTVLTFTRPRSKG
jgi:hypothetical protein